MCRICLFMVRKKSTKKYSNRIGQKTGISKSEQQVIPKAVMQPLVQANQNLNSGSRRAKGRNSSELRVGKARPSSEGSSRGLKKAMKLFRR